MSLSPKPLLHRLCFNELPCIYTFRVPTRFHLQKSKSPSSNLSHFHRLCSGTGDNNVSGSSDSRNKNHDHEAKLSGILPCFPGSRERSEMSRPSASNEYFLLIHCADILLFVNSMMMAMLLLSCLPFNIIQCTDRFSFFFLPIALLIRGMEISVGDECFVNGSYI
ncbi:hypothetical protein NC653_009685 [Populus alba x Populus x berolinensis]|uniref:Uncharacterized protein n=1 Tax=Populus alba x Populus x berolinensis TaxID=444605 RepID=A0AAD6RA23_9ROSI|nr:hypothetical protein NC653_009685 [Populus alba x Populus x berolinensis]